MSKLTVSLFLLLAAVGWFAYAGFTNGNAPMPPRGYVGLVIGAGVLLLEGVGLMTFFAYGLRAYDDSPRFRSDP